MIVAAVEVELSEGGAVQKQQHGDIQAMKSDIQELKDAIKSLAEMQAVVIRQVTNPDRGRARRR